MQLNVSSTWLCLIVAAWMGGAVQAEVTTFTNRAQYLSALGEPVRVVDFRTWDDGTDITDPAADRYFPYLGLRGLCFHQVASYWNLAVYTSPHGTIRVDLPPGTKAFGTGMGHFYDAYGTYTITLSTGEVLHHQRVPGMALMEFFGLISDSELRWVSFSLDATALLLDDFTVPASLGSVAGCPAPEDSEGPLTSGMQLTPNPVAVDSPVTLTAVADDIGRGDQAIAAAEYSIDSGAFLPMSGAFGTAAQIPISAALPGFPTAGVYSVCARATDAVGNVGELACVPLPVYDPSAGFVTGGGWIVSPVGAYTPDPLLTGRANFAFVARYQRGAQTPSGNTQFVFQAGNLNFRSTAYEWLVVAGARAQYKGTGTINGAPGFNFLLTAIDGDLLGGNQPDRFRLKIWDDGGVVYDNQAGLSDQSDAATALSGGSVVIHR